jgi:hypothetical protein
MRVKSLAHKNQMGKKKITNSSTSWVPSEFSQTDLTKAQKDGLIAEGDQVVFPSTERIPKPLSSYRVMFLAFLLHGLSFPAHEFLRGLFFVYGVQLHQLTPNSILHIACFVTLCESFLGIEPHWILWKFLFRSALVLLCRRSLSWAGLLFPPALRFIIWSLPRLPQCKVGRKNGFTSKTRKTLLLTNRALPLLMPTKIWRSCHRGIRLPQKLRWKTSSHC